LAAAALPDLPYACGLGTGGLFVDDVAEPVVPVDGFLVVAPVTPDPARLVELAAAPDRRQWWIDRVRLCHRLMS
jgi:O-succinylbenzoate synthase